MQYQVPQFIEVEDKIFGPFTLKQFIYLAGTGGIVAILLLTLPFFLGLIVSIPFIALGGSLAFVKINQRPFIEVLESGFFFFTGGRLYIWKKRGASVSQDAPKEEIVSKPQVQTPPPKEAMQKIQSLAQALDIQDQKNLHG